eukprot:5105709-Prorocentrum_lima.AAC.1
MVERRCQGESKVTWGRAVWVGVGRCGAVWSGVARGDCGRSVGFGWPGVENKYSVSCSRVLSGFISSLQLL